MEATQQTPIEEPPSERTKALLVIQSQLQDVTQDIREIRRILRQGESRWAAFWRAVTQFIGDLKNGR